MNSCVHGTFFLVSQWVFGLPYYQQTATAEIYYNLSIGIYIRYI